MAQYFKGLSVCGSARFVFVVTGLLLFLWLFLPPGFLLKFGPVTFRKEDLVRLLPLAIVAMVQPRSLLVRWHWIDIPVFIYCLCPLLCGLANNLGWRYSIWETTKEFGYWFVPYLLGRALLADGQNQFRLGLVLMTAALGYVPPTVFEIVYGPVLTSWFAGHEVRGAVRGTTFKPNVFLSSGFALTMFYVLAAFTALAIGWRYASSLVPSERRWFAVVLSTSVLFVLVVVASKSLGSIVFLCIGMALLLVVCTNATGASGRGLLVRLSVILLASVAPIYIGLRLSGWISTQRVHSIAMLFASEERAGSLAYRLRAEDILFRRMEGHWWLGWGKWGSWAQGASVMDIDGFWLFAWTRTGMLSVFAWLAMVTIPIVFFVLKRPDGRSGYASLSFVFALFLALSLIDSMFNFSGEAPQMLLVGSLTGSVLSGNTYLTRRNAGDGKGFQWRRPGLR